ncbi:MAG: prepilin-type cleavage/methylation domain-containing protein [Gammaproteobacteria bacterium HGW-Gammaproteobacteria-14]|nr:MAG: prepilin-type cleavage/methylation domain-containing protein [Gammaproteobacteria bacterium HGW-Gammaproteobacteria-14]
MVAIQVTGSTAQNGLAGVPKTCRSAGFSLIELMVVVAIIAILAVISYPNYSRYVQRTHEQQAQAMLMQAMSEAEAFRSRNFSYQGFVLPAEMLASDRYAYATQFSNNFQTLEITAAAIGPQAGAGGMGIDSSGRNCLNKGNDTGCNLGADPSWK